MANQMSYYYYNETAHSSTSNLIELDSPPCTTPSLTNCSTVPSIRSFSVASGIDDPYRTGTRDLAAAVMAALQRGETVDFDDEDYAADVLSLRDMQALEQQRSGSADGGRRGASPSPSSRVWIRSKKNGRLSSRIVRLLRELRRWIREVLHCK